MAKALINSTPFLENQTFCGLAIADYLKLLGAQANLEITDESPADLTINAKYLAILPKTLLHSLHEKIDLYASSGEPVIKWLSSSSQATLAPHESRPVNDMASLVAVESVTRQRIALQWITKGVRIIQPESTYIDADVSIDADVTIWPNVVLRGTTSIRTGSEIQSGCWIENTQIGSHVLIKAHSVCTGADIADHCQVGPMAHLRPGTTLEATVKVGNFVEIKKSLLRVGAKASHLSYIGDATVGSNANIGAGTITCNYDGHGKHQTQIGAGAFIGSNTALVAPVQIGDGAIVGAGSTISKDVPENALAVVRAPMRVLEGKAPSLHERNRVLAQRSRNKK